MLSATTRSALPRIAGSSSFFSRVSEPIAVMWVPSLICSARSSGVWDGVAVTMRLQLAATSSLVVVVWISSPCPLMASR